MRQPCRCFILMAVHDKKRKKGKRQKNPYPKPKGPTFYQKPSFCLPCCWILGEAPVWRFMLQLMHPIITREQQTEGSPSSWQLLKDVISEISHPMNIYSCCLWCDGKNKTAPTSFPHLWQKLVSPVYFKGDLNNRLEGIPQAKGTWNAAWTGFKVVQTIKTVQNQESHHLTEELSAFQEDARLQT